MVSNDTPRDGYERAMQQLSDAVGDTITERDGKAIRTFVKAHDEDSLSVTADVGNKEPRTLQRYAKTLRVVARRLDHYDTTLVDADADTINQFMESGLFRGDHPDVKDGGLTRNSVSNKQGVVRKFCRFSDDAVATADDIGMYSREDTKVDERDVLSSDEIEACRNACRRPRDRAMFELMLYTGQRVRAVQTLKIRDLDLDDGPTGKFWLNDDADGLKGASGKRPLLGAKVHVRDYLRNGHPCPDDPDANVFTVLPDYNPEPEYGDELHTTAIGRIIRNIGKRAGVDRLHPHLLRHTAVTILYRDRNVDAEQIRWLIGHDEGSNIMETTYAHVTDSDHIEELEMQTNYRDDTNENPISPPLCPRCDNDLSDEAVACDRCGYVFTMDAQQSKQQIEQDIHESKGEARANDDDVGQRAIEKLKEQIKNDPDLLDELLEE